MKKTEASRQIITIKKLDFEQLLNLVRQIELCAGNLAQAAKNTQTFCGELEEDSRKANG